MQKKHVLQDMLEPVIGLGYETVHILTIGQAESDPADYDRQA